MRPIPVSVIGGDCPEKIFRLPRICMKLPFPDILRLSDCTENEKEKHMRIAFFEAKPYDNPAFAKNGKKNGIDFKINETKLNEDTVELARGCDAVSTTRRETCAWCGCRPIPPMRWRSMPWLCC